MTVIIEFMASRTSDRRSRLEILREFRKRYIAPLGAPRKRVMVKDEGVTIALNAPGSLSLVPIALEIAFGTLDELTLEEAIVDPALGRWVGDLEPLSASLSVGRRGPPSQLAGAFRYEPPEYEAGHFPPFDAEASISVRFDEISSGIGTVRVRGDALGLAGMARHLVYLAQHSVAPGTRLLYSRDSMTQFQGLPLAIQREEFRTDDPWTAGWSALR